MVTALFNASSNAWAVVGGIYDEYFFAASGTARWEYDWGFCNAWVTAWAVVYGKSVGMYGRGLVRCFFRDGTGTFSLMCSLHGAVVSVEYGEELWRVLGRRFFHGGLGAFYTA
ncbi:hypothetical protein [Acaryochloris marina]|uniref:hypothetical protein n=1 Tax=Acaryochloris marina TaxID=155978 RepID=UPI0011D0DF6C|nr:hypothetical protein [Acaryochloris marina]